jgi:hypothetical protein
MTLLHPRVEPNHVDESDTEALIREARRLRHRRWLIGASLLAIVGAGVGVGISYSGGGSRSPGRTNGSTPSVPKLVVAPGVTMLNLTKSDKYGDIALVGGKMLLYGPAESESDPEVSDTCNSAVLNPVTLQLSNLETSSCANPALAGRTVLPVVTVEPKTPFLGGGVATVTVRVSRVTHGSPGYRLGPVVMTFPQESDGWPSWVYGDGSLWLYDSYSPGGYDLIRISEATGSVVQKIKISEMTEPIIAFDNDGLWLAPSVDGSPTQRSVLHLAIGAHEAVPVLTFPRGANDYANWMVATGRSVFLNVDTGGRTFTLWHFVGNATNEPSHVSLPAVLGDRMASDVSAAPMVGNSSGLWTASPSANGEEQRVLRFDPSSPAPQTVAILEPSYATPGSVLYGEWAAVTYDGSLYLLDPPAENSRNTPEGFSALYRVTSTKSSQ